jgi:hypothetical protein
LSASGQPRIRKDHDDAPSVPDMPPLSPALRVPDLPLSPALRVPDEPLSPALRVPDEPLSPALRVPDEPLSPALRVPDVETPSRPFVLRGTTARLLMLVVRRLPPS